MHSKYHRLSPRLVELDGKTQAVMGTDQEGGYVFHDELETCREQLKAANNRLQELATLELELQTNIYELKAALEGPDGYATWKDAAVAERHKRVVAEDAVKALEAEIAPMRESARIANERDLREQKLERIVDILFNEAASGSHGERNIKRRHPEKYWWWNGASITESDYNEYSGSFYITVDSYVGGGETEEYSMTIPKEWLDAEDPTALIDSWAADINSVKAERERLEMLRKAQRDMERAQQQIETLSRTVQQLQST